MNGTSKTQRESSDLNWLQRYYRNIDRYPWWVRFCLVWTILSIVTGLGVVIDRASADPSLSKQDSNSKTDRCVLEDPERPCWATPHNMNYYFHHGHTHGFKQLSSRFIFPPKFIHLAQKAHAAWCKIHGRLCKAQIDRYISEGFKTSDDCYWWCMYRTGLDSNGCAIGYSVAQWECDSGLHQQHLRMHLSHTNWVVIACLGETLIGGFIAKMVGAIAGAATCGFRSYTEWADDRGDGFQSIGETYVRQQDQDGRFEGVLQSR